ncbi:MAG: chloride channel protein [Marinilabiliaceae bacterium]|nr:chloride channel protein [Marinilabiliaceae bacterium]
MKFFQQSLYNLIEHFFVWWSKTISHKNFILIISVIVGILSGLAAIILKNTIHFIHSLLTGNFDLTGWNFLYLIYPMIGTIITLFYVRYIIKDDIGHGVSKILHSISKKEGYLRPHNTYSSIVGSSFTIGFGGSVGAEAPIVLTGATIGSTIGYFFRFNYKTITLLIGCGAAGAIAGIFKAPMAGLMFTLEVLMIDLTIGSIVPLLLSAVSGATVAFFFLGKGSEFIFALETPFQLETIPLYLLLGIFGGLVSLYMTKGTLFLEGKMGQFKNVYKKWIIGGLTLSLLIFLFPPLYGEGYDTISSLLNGNSSAIFENTIFYSLRDNSYVFLLFLVLLVLFKVVASVATNGSGGVGGIFAPTLFMGGVTGYFFARLLQVLGLTNVPISHFTLVGMAALMAGVMHAPLTAIFLIAEITHGYDLLIPLITVSTIAYVTNRYFEPYTIYTKRLARCGELITHHKDKAVLTLMKLYHVIETDFLRVNPQQTLRDLVQVISQSKRNLFPVVDDDNKFLGIVSLEDVRHIMFNQELYDSTKIEQLMTIPPVIVESDEKMDDVMRKFEETFAWNLAVVEKGKYIGFVSKSKIFSAYRNVLIHFSDDE